MAADEDELEEEGQRGAGNEEAVFLVGDGDENRRLDTFLAEKMPDISRSQLQRIIAVGAVQVNGIPAKPSGRTQRGDLILVHIPAPKPSQIVAEDIPLDIVYEDADLLVINKAKGMVVHPAPGAEAGTLVNALLAHAKDGLSGIGGEMRPGIVHRLDKDTTGLMVVAKNDIAHNGLSYQIQRKLAQRKYLALAWGRPNFMEAIVDAPIGRHPIDRKRMGVTEPGARVPGRPAVTELRVLEHLGPCTLLEATLQTGRTHQIRVHCSYAGYPVVGDSLYGGLRKVSADQMRGPAGADLNARVAALHGQCLHAYSLAFRHPRTEEPMQFEAPMPEEMQSLVDFLRSVTSGGGADTGEGVAR